jgi:MFS family permease
LAFVVLGGLMVALGVMIGSVIKGSFRQEYCPRHMLGRVTVSMQFLNYGAIPIGAMLGGGLSTVIGVRSTIWVMTSAFALSGLILLISPIRHHRDLPAAPSSAPSSAD